MSIASAQVESYYDKSTLDNLRSRAHKDPEQALEEVARQFESIFTRMMLKSMRAANFGNPLFDSDSGKFYQDMYDDQLAMDLSKNGSIGLADILVKQLRSNPVSKVSYIQPPPISNNKTEEKPAEKNIERNHMFNNISVSDVLDSSVINTQKSAEIELGTPEKFVKSLWSYAEQAGKELGIQPQALLAQAALETGWGKFVINTQDGQSSHNLFNIKADKRWRGESATKYTLEYESGIAKKEQASFRTYNSFAESFSDYVDFIKNSPRYKQALSTGKSSASYFIELQRAGYATDPNYASKIQRIMSDKPMMDAMAKLQLTQLDDWSSLLH